MIHFQDTELGSLLNARSLSHIDRFQQWNCNRDYSVADHSYWMTVIAFLIYEDLYDSEVLTTEDIDLDQLLLRCLFHDFGEIRTGDIPYPFKESDHFDEEGHDDYVEDYFSEDTVFKYYQKMITGKGAEDLTSNILACADMLELAVYCYEEELSGNDTFYPMLQKALGILEDEFSVLIRSSLFLQSVMEQLRSDEASMPQVAP